MLGPAGTLYAGAAGGEVLRTETDSGIPQDNPEPGSPTYSRGHGDIVAGIAWDDAGHGWAVDGAGTLRPVVPGDAGTVEPLARLDPPSGLVEVSGSLWMGGVDGGLWRMALDGQGGLNGAPQQLPLDGTPVALLPAADDALWVLTAEATFCTPQSPDLDHSANAPHARALTGRGGVRPAGTGRQAARPAGAQEPPARR